MFGLIDCNSFYCSVEQVYEPRARNKPVVVLSNNDGCVISRTKEAKALGIAMGEPAFKREKFYEENGVWIFSSNYTLYGDYSARVMETVKSLVKEVEIYSIDESFLNLSQYSYRDLYKFANEIRETVLQHTGIPTGIGVGPSKTLSKVANKLAKKGDGVCVLRSQEEIRKALSDFPVGDLWGVGGQYQKKLNSFGIFTALDLIKQNDAWILKQFTKVGLKMVKELRGEACYKLEELPPPKKNICVAKSFGHDLFKYSDVREALATYAAIAAAKLRRQGLCASAVIVFLETNSFKTELPQYCNSLCLPLPVQSNSTFEIFKYAESILDNIYFPGYAYKKTGILLEGLVSAESVQTDLFYDFDYKKQNHLMIALDKINAVMGRDTVKLAAQGTRRNFRMRQERLSKRFTTSWDELLTIRI